MRRSDNDFLTVLTPIADGPDTGLGHLDAIETLLERLRRQPAGPFDRCPMVHMARFVVVDELPLQLGDTRREFLARNYLLFVAELSGHRDDFLDGLFAHERDFVHSIWSHCAGYPHYLREALSNGRFHGGRYGATYFRRYINAHTIGNAFCFAAYPGASVDDVRTAIDARTSLTELIATNPPWQTSDAELLSEFRRYFP
jgi:hypothetical protein